MNKRFIVLCLTLLVLAGGACKLDLIDDPEPFGPAGFYIVLKGTATPSIVYINNNSFQPANTIIRIQVNKWDGTLVVNEKVYFEQWHRTRQGKVVYGYFGTPQTYVGQATTNAFGQAEIVYTYQRNDSNSMYIRAVLAYGRNEYQEEYGEEGSFHDAIQDWIPVHFSHQSN